jgi:uncharacterized iron-regulated membrane protein
MRLRQLFATLHLWIALISFILLVPIGLTGIVLAWPTQFQTMADPPPHATGKATLPPSAYFDAAQKAAGPRAQLSVLTLPQRDGQAVGVATAPQRPGPPAAGAAQPAAFSGTVWLDPANADVIALTKPNTAFVTTMRRFHEDLLVRGWGRTVVGISGVVLAFLALSGLYLWWPRGAFLKGFGFRRTANTVLNLHYTAGFWISIPLAIVAVTGVGISFPGLVRAIDPGATRDGGELRRPRAGAPTAVANLTPDQAAAAAQAAANGAPLVSVTKPANGQWRVAVSQGGARRVFAVDDATAEVASPRRPGGVVQTAVRVIHAGGGGVWWKWLVTLTGVAPLLFAATGIWTWARRKMRLRARAAQKAAA